MSIKNVFFIKRVNIQTHNINFIIDKFVHYNNKNKTLIYFVEPNFSYYIWVKNRKQIKC